jgi:hypothetical protein
MRRTAITAPAPPSEGESWLRSTVARPTEPKPTTEPPAPAGTTPGRMVAGVMPVPPLSGSAEAELRAHLARQMALPAGWQPLV